MKRDQINFTQAMQLLRAGELVYFSEAENAIPIDRTDMIGNVLDPKRDFYTKEVDPKEELDEKLGEIIKTGFVRKDGIYHVGIHINEINWNDDTNFLSIQTAWYSKKEVLRNWKSMPDQFIPPHKREKQ